MGPLAGIRIVELGGIGPAPFAAMMLADMGAEVVRIDRPDAVGDPAAPAARTMVLHRGRRSIVIDLKVPRGRQVALRLIDRADGLIEGFRPGVMERLELGPDECTGRNPKLVYARMTGWGQEGPLAGAAGHDINYIALAGALHAIGGADGPPVPPLNLLGDFGGGGMLLAFGMVCALFEASRSGRGQVIDAAMLDGTATLLAHHCAMRAAGDCDADRATNRLSGSAPDYAVYECADGEWIAIGALEPAFYDLLLETAGIDDPELATRGDAAAWAAGKKKMAAIFGAKPRAEWCELLEGTDACFAPVLDVADAARHPHNAARGFFVELDGVLQPAPAPRFSRTPGRIQGPPPQPGEHGSGILADWGFSDEAIAELEGADVIRRSVR